jgi:hypothetical protein
MDIKQSAMDYYNDIKKIRAGLKSHWDNLHSQLSICDKKLVDLDHVQEFYDFNASQGYKLYKMRKDVLVERRDIKNEIEEFRPLIEKTGEFENNKIKDVIHKIVEKNDTQATSKTYKVRVLTELFGNSLKGRDKPTI